MAQQLPAVAGRLRPEATCFAAFHPARASTRPG